MTVQGLGPPNCSFKDGNVLGVNIRLGRLMTRHPLAAMGQPVIVVESCTFESGDLTSFTNGRSNIILVPF